MYSSVLSNKQCADVSKRVYFTTTILNRGVRRTLAQDFVQEAQLNVMNPSSQGQACYQIGDGKFFLVQVQQALLEGINPEALFTGKLSPLKQLMKAEIDPPNVVLFLDSFKISAPAHQHRELYCDILAEVMRTYCFLDMFVARTLSCHIPDKVMDDLSFIDYSVDIRVRNTAADMFLSQHTPLLPTKRTIDAEKRVGDHRDKYRP